MVCPGPLAVQQPPPITRRQDTLLEVFIAKQRFVAPLPQPPPNLCRQGGPLRVTAGVADEDRAHGAANAV